jgi:ribosomal protein S18 acetylase RimI-like enzyme
MEIRAVGPGDEQIITAASHLFDQPAQGEATHRFLRSPGHHLLIATVDGRLVGFISGVEMSHPDKGTEMFVYELGVEEPFRTQGIGHALTERLKDVAVQGGCYGMWVVTEEDNQAALATYSGSGAVAETGQTVVVWTFPGP